MGDVMSLISKNIVQIIMTIITGIIGYIGIRIKSMIQDYIQLKIKKEIVEKTVMYVEQVGKNLTCEEKKKMVLDKSLEWLNEKKVSVSDTELEILIESAVNCLS